MGGVESAPAKAVKGAALYGKWTSADVLSAWRRAQRLRPTPPTGRFAGDHAIRLNRREFVEVFMDLETVTPDNEFLALPIEQFDACHPDQSGRVDVLEVLLPMCLCCKAANAVERSELCYRIYDLDADSQIDLGEMTAFITRACSVMHHAGLIPERLGSRTLELLGESCFRTCDTDKSGWVSTKEFSYWVGKFLLTKRFQVALDNALDTVRTEYLQEKRRKREAARQAQLEAEYHLHSVDTDAAGAGDGDGGDTDRPSDVAALDGSGSGSGTGGGGGLQALLLKGEAAALQRRKGHDLNQERGRRRSLSRVEGRVDAFGNHDHVRAEADAVAHPGLRPVRGRPQGATSRPGRKNRDSRESRDGAGSDGDGNGKGSGHEARAKPSAGSSRSGRKYGATAAIYGAMAVDDAARAAMLAARVRQLYMHTATLKRARLRTAYADEDLAEVRKMFIRHAPRNELVWSYAIFRTALKTIYPKLRRHPTADICLTNLFRAVDVNLSGDINFAEFAQAMSTLTRGSIEDRADLLFEVFDVDGDGYVRTQELVQLLQHDKREFVKTTKFADRILELIDTDCNGSISRDEMVTAMARHPILYDCFVQAVLPGIDTAETHAFRDLRPRVSRFDFERLKQLYMRCVRVDAKGTVGMNISRFRVYMLEEFQCHMDMLPIVNRAFEVLDEDHSGYLDWREIFYGLERVMGSSGDIEERAQFYFEVYDADSSGTIDGAEIMGLLYSSHEGANVNAESVAKMMRHFDVDGDGSVTLDEFKTACSADPNLLECFGRLFGVDHNNAAAADSLVASQKKVRKLSAVITHAALKAISGDQMGHSDGGPGVNGAAVSSLNVAGKQLAPGALQREMVAARRANAEARAAKKSGPLSKMLAKHMQSLRRQSLVVMSNVVTSLQRQAKLVSDVREQAGLRVDPMTGQMRTVGGLAPAVGDAGAGAGAGASGAGASGAGASGGGGGGARPLSAGARTGAGGDAGSSRVFPDAASRASRDQAAAREALNATVTRRRSTVQSKLDSHDKGTRDTSTRDAYEADLQASQALEQEREDLEKINKLVVDDKPIRAAAAAAAGTHARGTSESIKAGRAKAHKDAMRADIKLDKVLEGGSKARKERSRQRAIAGTAKAARLEHALDLSVDVSCFDECAAARPIPRRVPDQPYYIKVRPFDGLDEGEDGGEGPIDWDAVMRGAPVPLVPYHPAYYDLTPDEMEEARRQEALKRAAQMGGRDALVSRGSQGSGRRRSVEASRAQSRASSRRSSQTSTSRATTKSGASGRRRGSGTGGTASRPATEPKPRKRKGSNARRQRKGSKASLDAAGDGYDARSERTEVDNGDVRAGVSDAATAADTSAVATPAVSEPRAQTTPHTGVSGVSGDGGGGDGGGDGGGADLSSLDPDVLEREGVTPGAPAPVLAFAREADASGDSAALPPTAAQSKARGKPPVPKVQIIRDYAEPPVDPWGPLPRVRLADLPGRGAGRRGSASSDDGTSSAPTTGRSAASGISHYRFRLQRRVTLGEHERQNSRRAARDALVAALRDAHRQKAGLGGGRRGGSGWGPPAQQSQSQPQLGRPGRLTGSGRDRFGRGSVGTASVDSSLADAHSQDASEYGYDDNGMLLGAPEPLIEPSQLMTDDPLLAPVEPSPGAAFPGRLYSLPVPFGPDHPPSAAIRDLLDREAEEAGLPAGGGGGRTRGGGRARRLIPVQLPEPGPVLRPGDSALPGYSRLATAVERDEKTLRRRARFGHLRGVSRAAAAHGRTLSPHKHHGAVRGVVSPNPLDGRASTSMARLQRQQERDRRQLERDQRRAAETLGYETSLTLFHRSVSREGDRPPAEPPFTPSPLPAAPYSPGSASRGQPLAGLDGTDRGGGGGGDNADDDLEAFGGFGDGYGRSRSSASPPGAPIGASGRPRPIPTHQGVLAHRSIDTVTSDAMALPGVRRSRPGTDGMPRSRFSITMGSLPDPVSATLSLGLSLSGSSAKLLDVDKELGIDDKTISKYRRSRRYGYGKGEFDGIKEDNERLVARISGQQGR